MPLLAVYGTLRRGLVGHKLMRSCRFLWSGFVEIPYTMVVKDCIPYLVPCEELRRIFVEIYDVPTDVMKLLDNYEEVPKEYVRVTLYLHPYGFAYIYIASRRVDGEVVEHGDYLAYACQKCLHLVEDQRLCIDLPG